MFCHHAIGGAVGAQRPRGPQMQSSPRRRGHVAEHRGPGHAEQLDRAHRLGQFDQAQPGELGQHAGMRRPSEHGHRVRRGHDSGRTAAQPGGHHLAAHLRTALRDPPGGLGRGRNPVLLQRPDQACHRQRVAAGRVQAGGDELGCRCRRDQRGDVVQRHVAQRDAAARGDDLAIRRVVTRLTHTNGEHERDGQPLDAQSQIGEPAHGGGISPVRVVHRDQQPGGAGYGSGQPVDAVQHGEVGGERGQLERPECFWWHEVRVGHVEELGHDPERQIAFQGTSARPHDASARGFPPRGEVVERRGLARTGRAFHDSGRAGRHLVADSGTPHFQPVFQDLSTIRG